MFLSKHRNLFRVEQIISRMASKITEKSLREGTVEIYVSSDKVFYNPVQEFNRDLSIAVLNVFTEDYAKELRAKYEAKKLKQNNRAADDKLRFRDIEVVLLEALSATGLRSIRYAKEVPYLTRVIANDMSEAAVATIQDNVSHNEVSHIVEASHDDATMIMYKHKEPGKRFAAVDLDPYGCPTIFLDAAVQCVQDGGLLLVTATDMAVLAGNSPESCFAKYGATSIKSKACHEMALRILLQSIERHAIQYGRYIIPLLSVSVDFYIRVFVKVYSSALECKKSSGKISMVYHCTGCDNMHLHPMIGVKPNPTERNPNQEKTFLPPMPPIGEFCDNCNQRIHVGGPIWTGPLHDQEFVSRVRSFATAEPVLLNTNRRIAGVLSMIGEELPDVPMHYCMGKLFGSARLQTMPLMVMRSALLNAGYRVSYSHTSKTSVKTDAPSKFVWDVVRTWAKMYPPSPAKLETDARARSIISRDITHEVDLTPRPDANPESRRESLLRFQQNPAPYWGPGTRSELNVCEEAPKSRRNQNKYRNPKHQKRHHSQSGDEGSRKKPDTDVTDTNGASCV